MNNKDSNKNANKNKDKHENINKNEELEKLEYKILGDLFVADMLNVTMDGDTSMQNLLMYYDSEDIKEAIKKISKD